MNFVNSSGNKIEVSDTVLQELKEQFKQALQPFGLGDWVSNAVPKIYEAVGCKLLAEFRTARFPIWYPEKLPAIMAAGFDVHTAVKKSEIHAACKMYWVQGVYEIGGIKNGN